MKAKLEFDLDNFDDREAHMRCVKSLNLCLVLFDLDQELRKEVKHASDETAVEYIVGMDKARMMLRELMEKHNIDLEELMT